MLTNRQKRDNIRKWIKVLRSGEYMQTTGVLRRESYDPTTDGKKLGYCCLGVLCDTFKPENAEWVPGTNGKYSMFNASFDVPTEIVALTGISGTEFETWNDGVGLATLNDSYDATFDEIADMLDLWLLDTAK